MKKITLLAASSAVAFIAVAALLRAPAGNGAAEPRSLAEEAGAESAEASQAPETAASEPEAQTGIAAKESGDEPQPQTGLELEAGINEAGLEEAQTGVEPEKQTSLELEAGINEAGLEEPQTQIGVNEPTAEKSFESQNALALAGKSAEPDSAQDFEVREYRTGILLEPSVTVFNSSVKPALAYEKGSFAEAAAFARTQPAAVIFWAKNGAIIWENANPLPEERIMKVDRISQLPELPRGCEVTSLAMLLNARGISADKLELAERIAKDETPLEVRGGEIHFGDPNKGFVGSIYDLDEDGYGVYHKPIYDLLREYAPESAIDMTGCEFDDVLQLVAAGCPVWVVTNSWYQELPETQFETWQVPGGEIRATYREHSVLVTGFDSQRIFFNDPLLQAESALRDDFTKAWIQMGRQAVTAA